VKSVQDINRKRLVYIPLTKQQKLHFLLHFLLQSP